jgi:asparagine synthase (glutamine-hydrolysing)
MCGIAGMVDLTNRRPVPVDALEGMAQAIFHRGPDEGGFFVQPGLGLASRRLSILGLFDGRQPITNEDGNAVVVYNGEQFEYPELRGRLEHRGHTFRTHSDTEIIPHLWEDHGEQMFDQIRGQFAFALWDKKKRQLILGRDRIGICPLFWTKTTDGWLLFASEIKALLSSGMVDARFDPRGINHIFTFFAVPGPVTCFAGIEAVVPGHYLSIRPAWSGGSPKIEDRTYWAIDFPDEGQEDPFGDSKVVDDFERIIYESVERRLRADVPVVSYLSGGVDSSLVVAMASKILGEPIPTFTVRVRDPQFDESAHAAKVNRHTGSSTVIVNYGNDDMRDHYVRLVRTAESPVVDTACAAVMLLAEQVHAHGYKVTLSGEGADEWMAGYPWFRIDKLFNLADAIPGLKWSRLARRLYLRIMNAPTGTRGLVQSAERAIGDYNAWMDVYAVMSMNRLRFFTRDMQQTLAGHEPYADLGINSDRLRKWHPLNRALCLGARIMLPGMLLAAKGDRVAMHSSVEARYPFLDEEVINFLAKISPSWKLHGWCEKYLLRRVAERWLPKSIAWRRKMMFRAPFDAFHTRDATMVDQLLSPQSLHRSGYFDPQAVGHWRHAYRSMLRGTHKRTSVEMGLVGVIATQLWHHLFIDANLADIPGWQASERNGVAEVHLQGSAGPTWSPSTPLASTSRLRSSPKIISPTPGATE